MSSAALSTLVTARLELRPRTLAHLDANLAMDADPEVTRYTGSPLPRDELRACFLHDFGPGLGYRAIFAKTAPERFLGWAILIPLSQNPEIEVGYRLVREAWGKGYATEAARAVIDYGFGELGLREIAAVIDPENAASRRVLEKCGFTQHGQRRAYGLDLPFFLRFA